jgi:hypothetical protein
MDPDIEQVFQNTDFFLFFIEIYGIYEDTALRSRSAAITNPTAIGFEISVSRYCLPHGCS